MGMLYFQIEPQMYAREKDSVWIMSSQNDIADPQA